MIVFKANGVCVIVLVVESRNVFGHPGFEGVYVAPSTMQSLIPKMKLEVAFNVPREPVAVAPLGKTPDFEGTFRLMISASF